MKKDKRSYRVKGLELSNLTFKNNTEKKFVLSLVSHVSFKIKVLRVERGLSQEALAEMANVSISTIKFIEQNQRSPSLPMLFKLIYILDPNARVWD
ncbi:helix-turn-helix transcriptional regulator [Bacteriovorax stolpii]|uniref:helix-turn-helix transcriptional regulator n=1 Tax=Bacteriovorax stolpii TaxID=960 RepID=UPI001C8CFFA1|nr:helix-turn-helix transcriptional regulator [Bacteriovorax stolpii]